MRSKKSLPRWAAALSALLLVFVIVPLVYGGTAPTLKQGRKWRIAYYQGGSYSDYRHTFVATLKGLVRLGWIKPLDLPRGVDESDNKCIWNYLSKQAPSDYLEFVADGFMSADWKRDKRRQNKKTMLERLAKVRDIDLVIAMGTWAGQDLANRLHSVPVFVMSTSDPVRAGIVKSPKRSGLPHVFARCDPKRHERQIRLFHRIFRFKKLGMILNDSQEGRTYAAWDDVARVARERGFRIVPCHVKIADTKTEEMIEQYKKCLAAICPKIDAFWMIGIKGFQARYLANYLPILLKYKVPTWSMVQDLALIRHGILMAMSKKDFGPLGLFQAETMARIFNGAKPGDLDQVFEDMNTLAINLKTAELIGARIPNSILRVSDTMFTEIEPE